MTAPKKRRPLPVGTTGYARHKRHDFKIEVVSTPSGLAYRVGRTIYPSPSTAAKAVTGTETNGWLFWHLDED